MPGGQVVFGKIGRVDGSVLQRTCSGTPVDGTFVMDWSGHLEDPAVAGTYTLRGDTVRFIVLSSSFCTRGDTWVWKASLRRGAVEEYLHVLHTRGGCTGEVEKGERWLRTRVG
jgi:hypothetical protein